MSKVWKWILGIVVVLVIVGALVAIGYAWQTHMGAVASYRSMPFDREWNSPMPRGNWQHPMMGGRGEWPVPMGRMGFARFGGFHLFGRLAGLLLFVGLLYGAYWLGRRNARVTLDPSPAARVDAPASPETDSASAPRRRTKKTE